MQNVSTAPNKVQSINNVVNNNVQNNNPSSTQMSMQNGQEQTIESQMQNDQMQMQNIQNKIKAIQNRMQTNKSKVQNIQTQMQSDQNQVQLIKSKIQNDQNEINTIKSKVQSKQNQIQNDQNQMNNIQNKMQSDQKQMQNIQSQMQNDQMQMQNIQNEIKEIQNRMQLNQKKIQESNFAKMPVVDICNSIILTAIDSGASDIHMDPTEEGITVRIRIDGLLRDYLKLPKEIKQNVITRIKIMAGMNITETRLPQDGAIKDRLKGKDLDLRVSSLPTKRGEKIVIRIMDYSMSLKGIEYLYFSETNYKKVLKMLSTPNGIILVTGATGTGKSTTLYSFLQKLNVEGSNLITVEDPVEMDIAGVNQVQVNSDIGLDFAAVLRSILRQDPNVIMIGEIRDSETAQIAVRASITGHLVLSTIHTNNSLNTIERLLDMDVERYLLASALEGIVSQKLARMLCSKCKIKRPTTASEKNLFKSVLGQDIKEIYDANPSGCPYCTHGYKGRIAVQEVLLINQDIRDAISAGMRKDELRKLVYNKDVITMLQDGLFKVVAGFTTTDEILKLIEVDDAKIKL